MGNRAFMSCGQRAGALLAILLASAQPRALPARPADESRPAEYQVEAAYLYHFLQFTRWPATTQPPAATVTIGILGASPFGNAFAAVEGKELTPGRRLVVRPLGRYQAGANLTACDLLFICASETKALPRILAAVKGRPILTVSDARGFIEAGGMVQFSIVAQKVRWSVNRAPVEEAGLQLSSQVLRNALNVLPVPPPRTR